MCVCVCGPATLCTLPAGQVQVCESQSTLMSQKPTSFVHCHVGHRDACCQGQSTLMSQKPTGIVHCHVGHRDASCQGQGVRGDSGRWFCQWLHLSLGLANDGWFKSLACMYF